MKSKVLKNIFLIQIPGTGLFMPDFWRNLFKSYFNFYVRNDTDTQKSGLKLWPFETEDKVIEDPQEAMIRYVINDDKHFLSFCCCVYLNILTTQEEQDDMNLNMACDDDKILPIYHPDFMDVVLAQHNSAPVVAFCQHLHDILEVFRTRGHPMRTSPAILRLSNVSKC